MSKSEQLQIDDLDVTLIRSARRKRLSLEVGVKGVQARAPSRMRLGAIVAFVQSKRSWIDQHLANLPDIPSNPEFSDGVSIHYRGTPTLVILKPGSKAPVKSTSNGIEVPVSESHLPLEVSAKTKLIKWLKQQTKAELDIQVASFAERMRIPRSPHQPIRVRDYKRRWGSCDAHGALSFNWRLILAPPEVLNYVVVHELAHCLEFNHSRRFWAIVEQEVPNRKEYQHWLNQYGITLYQL